MNMISRRRMVKGLVAGLPLAAVLVDHAFANPTSARYDKEDAPLTWKRTTKFFAKHLKG